jgi:hypothetical protein
MKGDFLLRLNSHSLICYCGRMAHVIILDEIEKREKYCFASCESLLSVTFTPMSRLLPIEEMSSHHPAILQSDQWPVVQIVGGSIEPLDRSAKNLHG